ncbi:MAG: hypothetical protein C0391_00860 [Anaerolinea sp.]|nr:hypothetical protein [Anaerolinea sp.]
MTKKMITIFYLLMLLILAACTPAALPAATQAQPTVDLNPIYTAAVQTYEAESTRKASLLPTATEVILPTDEPATATPETIAVVTTPTVEPTLWIPPSGSTYPTITATMDTNCRLGPDKVYEVVGALRVSDISKVHGKLLQGGWWYIENVSNDEPQYCWVWAETTKVTGDTTLLPFITPPLPPAQSNPQLTLTITAAPPASVVCPSVLTITATITTDRETTLTYQIVNESGSVLKSGTMVFADDGTQTVSFSGTYNADDSGWVQLRVTSPVTGHSTKAAWSVDCP